MRALNVTLAILVSLGLAFAVFEGGLRLFPAFRPQKSINEFHPNLGWAKTPDTTTGRSTSEFDIEFTINSQGLRDDSMDSTAKAPNSFRVMMLGDSFVLGYTVDRQDLFVDLTEQYWRSEQRRVDVINAGTEGYSTDQQVLWFREYGKAYEPDLVLIFPYENDIYWNGQERYTRYPKPRFRPDGTVETGRLENPGRGSALSKLAVGNFLGKVVAPALASLGGNQVPPHSFQPDGSEAWIYNEFAPLFKNPPTFVEDALDRTRGALRALKGDCEEIGARLLMVPIPSESAIHAAAAEDFGQSPQGLQGVPSELWSADRPVDAFLSIAKDEGIEAIDPRAELRGRDAQGEVLYFDLEWHFNPEGNRAFATYLIDELDKRNVFPDEHAAITQGSFPTHEEEGGVPTWLFVYGVIWLVLGSTYFAHYRDEGIAGFGKVGALLAVVFAIILGIGFVLRTLPPAWAPWAILSFVLIVLGFVAYKLGRRVGTIAELLKAFTLRGHWYLMPLVVVLLSIGSLLVVAASSPLIAPFIYTLF